jgi:hypothetical protein
MQKRFGTWKSVASSLASLFVGILACELLLCSGLVGQDAAPPSLQEQLKAQYKLVKIGPGPTGPRIIDPGTVLDVQKGGLLAVPPLSMMVCPAKFQDNELKSPTGMCPAMVKQVSRYLQVGTKVYPAKIDVNFDKDKVTITVIECDTCNGVQELSSFKSEVAFQFAKGGLRSVGVSQLEDMIGQVLSIDSGGDSQQQGDQGGGNQDQGGGQQGGNQQGGNQQQSNNNGGGNNGGAQAQQQAPPAEPQQIEKGQTPDQVKAAIGTPDKIVNLGSKQIYVYKDIKVTFLNGKVSDVQ